MEHWHCVQIIYKLREKYLVKNLFTKNQRKQSICCGTDQIRTGNTNRRTSDYDIKHCKEVKWLSNMFCKCRRFWPISFIQCNTNIFSHQHCTLSKPITCNPQKGVIALTIEGIYSKCLPAYSHLNLPHHWHVSLSLFCQHLSPYSGRKQELSERSGTY